MVEALKPSIVRLFTTEDIVVGTGFLVGTQYIATCAHVVNRALKRTGEPVEQPAEDQKVYLDFPHSSSQKRYEAHVVCWHPPQPLHPSGVKGVRDIAILQLDKIAPPDAAETQ